MKPSNFDSAYGDVLGGAVSVAITKLADGRAILKQAARGATTGAITLATGLEAGDTIDGLVLAEGDRILVWQQADATENGVYTVEASGAPTRTLDADTGAELLGCYVSVIDGTVNAGKLFHNTNTSAPDLGTDDVTFEEATFGAALTVEETDASPSVPDVVTIQVPAGGLTDNGGGDVTLEYAQRVGGGRHKRSTLGNLGAAHTFDVATANYFTGTLDDATAVDFTGWTAGTLCEIGIRFTQDGTGHTPDFSGAGVTWVGDTEPTWPTDPGVSFETGFWSEDGGTTIVGGMLGAGGGSNLTVEDEGTPLATAATTLDFVGAGVTASGAGAEKTITIPGDAAHIADTTDAHDASAISFSPVGTIAATDVQAAIAEVASEAGSSNKFVVDPGAPTYDDTDPDEVLVTVVAKFGIDGGGAPYFNSAGVTSGEEAALMRDPDAGTYFLRSYNF